MGTSQHTDSKRRKPRARKSAALAAAPSRRVVHVASPPFGVTYSARAVANAMERTFRTRGSRALLIVKKAFQLSSADLGRLFGGVTRQAIEKWLERGVPANRIADVDRVAEIATELTKRFKPQRLPTIVRTPMAVLDNRSIYDVLRVEGAPPIYEFFRRWEALVPGSDPIRAGKHAKRKDALIEAR